MRIWNLKIKDKVVILMTALLFLLGLSTLGIAFFELKDSYNYHFYDTKKYLMNERKSYLEDQISSIYQTISWYASNLPEEQAKLQAKELIGKLRYSDDSGYFVIFEKKQDDLYFVVHGIRKDWAGTKADLSVRSRDGVYYRKELLEKALAGGGYSQYDYLNPVSKNIVHKISYAQYFVPWNWMIMGGIYIDDVQKKLDVIATEMKNEEWDLLIKLISLSCFFLFLSLSLGYWGIGGELKKILKSVFDEMDELILAVKNGNLKHRGDLNKIHFEFQNVLVGMNQMVDHAVAPILEAKDILEKMASADLRNVMEGNYLGDHQILKLSLNGTLESMNRILRQVKLLVQEVSVKAQQLSTTTESLSLGTVKEGEVLKNMSGLIRRMQELIEQNGSLLERTRVLSGSDPVQLEAVLKNWDETLKFQVDQITMMLNHSDKIEEIRQHHLVGMASYVNTADQLNDEAVRLATIVEKFKLSQ